MSSYLPGDVLLVPFPFSGEQGNKLRPALVIGLSLSGDPVCCPVRSSPRAGALCVPIGIDDFASGGLDLFSESYVQADTVRTIRNCLVVGRKGRVTPEYLTQVTSLVPR